MNLFTNTLMLALHCAFFIAGIYVVPKTFPSTTSIGCMSPWIVIMGMMLGNLAVASKLAGVVLCNLWQGNNVSISSPGLPFMICVVIAGACYIWNLVLLNYIQSFGVFKLYNCTSDVPKSTHDLMWGNFAFGVLHIFLVAGAILYRLSRPCWESKQTRESRQPLMP